jgi:hypothetical protein
MLYLCILLVFVFFAGVAMTVAEGLWSNAIGLLAVIFAGVFAVAAGFPLGLAAREQFQKEEVFTWYFLFAGCWIAFFAFIVVFRVVAERISRVRMRFVPPLENAGGPLMGLLTALMFTSFASFTLLIPMAAKEWDLQKAESWQQSTVTLSSAPFITVYNRITGEDLKARVGLQ